MSIRLLFAIALVAGRLFSAAVAGAEAEPPIVVWISLDGVRHDALAIEGLPALQRIARQGAAAEALLPVFPSSTFANHVAQATGTHADRHGVVGNRFLDPELGYFDYGNDARFLEAEPIWAAAERQGVRAATFFWVGSETDWRGVGASFRRAPFQGGLPERVKVDQILAWLDLPEAERPRLIMSWWHGADRAGHRSGPGTPEVAAQLRQQDEQLLRVLEGIDARGLWGRITLIVSSDHGMISADRLLDAGSLLRKAGLPGRVIHGTSVAHVHLRDPSQVDEALAAFAGIEGLTAWRTEELPEALRYRHPTRVGQIVLLAEPPLRLGGSRRRTQALLEKVFGKARGGAHGYDPAKYEEMHAILLSMGRGVAAGTRLGRSRAIDLAPSVAALLGIDPPASSEGEIIPGLGAPLSEPRGATSAP
ncbi:MAG: alkaline phosphatase family protein [Deltaproteobacteria bacterium]|nr:alkaline phosphatase family protein [Deltaproteobacteria bacterium]MBW2393761.1 alkaline phosphatase family protein [Deltaproteobacteria bacterium]